MTKNILPVRPPSLPFQEVLLLVPSVSLFLETISEYLERKVTLVLARAWGVSETGNDLTGLVWSIPVNIRNKLSQWFRNFLFGIQREVWELSCPDAPLGRNLSHPERVCESPPSVLPVSLWGILFFFSGHFSTFFSLSFSLPSLQNNPFALQNTEVSENWVVWAVTLAAKDWLKNIEAFVWSNNEMIGFILLIHILVFTSSSPIQMESARKHWQLLFLGIPAVFPSVFVSVCHF